jgi:putative CocE/NonD family hydrolase
MTPHIAAKHGTQDVDESSDTYDTIEWLIKNLPANNGKVGMWGISYPGFYTAAGMIDAHPALVAASPQAPVSDLYMGDDSFHNGAFFLAANFGFYGNFMERKGDPAPPNPQRESLFEIKTPDGYDFYKQLGPMANTDEKYFKRQNPYWTAILDHPNYDEYWKSRNILQHIKQIKPAVMVVGGWYDAEDLQGPLKMFRNIEGSNKMLVMGPWPHGGWARSDGQKLGNIDFASKTSEYYRKEIEFAFFQQHLKGKDAKLPRAYVFQTGANQWRLHEAWPPANATPKTFYLDAKGKLSSSAPKDQGFDEYVSDPAKPVPFLSYTAQGMTRDYMTADQRFATTRPDVLVYETEVLEDDLTIAGPIQVKLKVSTSGTDSDFVVKVVDVYPSDYPTPEDVAAKGIRMGGYQQLVRGEPFRGKYRKSFEKPEAFTPGQADTIEFAMPDVYHTFRRGHKMMVHVQSTWFPLIDRNPQKFVDIMKAKASDFQPATERVWRPSSITVTVEP